MSTVAPPLKPLAPALADSEHFIDEQISRTRRSLKLVDLAAGVITLSIGLLSYLLVAALLDHWVVPGGLNPLGRTILFVGLLAAVAWYSWRQFVPLLKPINPVFAAHTIERGSPSLKNSLLNLVLFRTRRQHMSARVFHALEQQAALRLSTASLDGAVDRSAILRLGYALLLIVALIAAYGLLSPKNLAVSASRVLVPWSDVAAPSRVQVLEVRPGDTSVARGERLAVSAEIHGLAEDETVKLRYSTDDEQTDGESISMTRPQGSARFEASLPRGSDAATIGVQQKLQYWIEAGDARTKRFKVDLFNRPTLIVQQVRYEYPAYTGIPSKEASDTGDIRALEGTRVVISALASEPIKSAHVDFDADGRNDQEMNIEGDRALASFTLAIKDDRRTPVHSSYVLRLTTASGRTNADPVKYRIEVTPDYAPEVRITEPEEPEISVAADKMTPIRVEARDPDFALAQVQLVGKVGERDVEIGELLTANHDGQFRGMKPFVPADAQLKPGDVLEYWAEAIDNRRPEANVTPSEHRRLRILGPANPQRGDGKQQPGNQEGNPQAGENGEGGENGGQQGENKQGGEAGGQQEGADGKEGGDKGQKGPGAQGSGDASDKGKPGEQGENPEGGAAGQNGEGSPDQAQQNSQPQGGGAAGGKNAAEKPMTGDNSAGGNEADPSQNPGEQNADAKSQPGGNPSDGEKSPAGNPQGGTAAPQQGVKQQGDQQNAQPSKVSADGDNDGEAMQRIVEQMDKDQQNNSGKEPAGGQQQTGNEPSGKGQEPAGANKGAQNQNPANQTEQRADAQAGDSNQQTGDESGKPTGAAGDAAKNSQLKPPAEGAKPTGPQETPSDANQKSPSNGEDSNKQQGADKPREARTGDGNPEEPKQPQGASPDSAMNQNDGDAGSGHSDEEQQGAPGDEQSFKQGRNKTDDDNRKGQPDPEPPGGSPDKKESNSKGGQKGEQSGGGESGGGQHADAPGKGEAGQQEAADEGAGAAQEKGNGETGAKAGDDKLAKDETGESSGNKPGAGSEQGAGEKSDNRLSKAQPEQPTGDPSEQSPQPDAKEPGGKESGQPQGAEQQPGAQPPTAGQPGEQGGQPGNDAGQPSANPPQGDEPPPGEQPPQKNQPNDSPLAGQPGAAAGQPQGGGQGANLAGSSSASDPLPGDAANIEFAKKQTDLVLERLDEQLAKKKVDPELLKSLGWSEDELRRFVDRWKGLKTRAETTGKEEDKRELDDALRSLGLRPQGPQRINAAAKEDKFRDLNEGIRKSAPLEYADRVREYAKDVSASE